MPRFKKRKKSLVKKLQKPRGINAKQNQAINSLNRQIRMLRSLPEVKFITSSHLTTTMAAGQHNFILNTLSQGSNATQRIGDSVKMLSLFYKGMFYHNSTNNSICRAIIYMNTQNNGGTTVTISELLHITTPNTDACISVTNPTFVGKGKKYHIFMDRTFTISAGAISGNSGSTSTNIGENAKVRHVKKVIKLGHKVRFTSNLGTGADIENNALRLMVIFGDAEVSYGHSFKLTYVDA